MSSGVITANLAKTASSAGSGFTAAEDDDAMLGTWRLEANY